jgi:hypothetical protein
VGTRKGGRRRREEDRGKGIKEGKSKAGIKLVEERRSHEGKGIVEGVRGNKEE